MESHSHTTKWLARFLLAGCCLAGVSPCFAQTTAGTQLTSQNAVNYDVTQSADRLEMIVKSSRILTLNQRIPKFQVHNEEVLGAAPVSQNQVKVFAKTPGTTQVNLWDADNGLYTVDVTVIADAREVEGVLGSQLPLAALKVTPLEKSAIISGTVTNVDDVDRAIAITEQFYSTVINNIRVVGVQQILLHTKIMEVSRTKFRDVGVDWGLRNVSSGEGILFGPGGMIDAGATSLRGPLAAIPFQANGRASFNLGNYDFDSLIVALRQNELIKMLAEPTVVATHGRPARFIVGGKVPYLVPSQQGVTVNYEEFGTSVDFLPFIVGPGRIRLEVRPEVSEPDPSRGLTLQGVQVPGFRSRYVDTAVEMQAGQTFAIAGLLQNRTEATTRAVPLLGELPYFGSMFRRVSEEQNEIELLITVTPELVDAMDPHEVPHGGPGLNSNNPSDHELYLKGHIEVPNTGQACEPWESGEMIPGGAPVYESRPEMLPPGAIVPSPQGSMVAPGVTILSPATP